MERSISLVSEDTQGISPLDTVNAPSHYRQESVETIDQIKAGLTQEEYRGHCKGCAMKYIKRERLKGGDVDLQKAVWYLREALGRNRR